MELGTNIIFSTLVDKLCRTVDQLTAAVQEVREVQEAQTKQMQALTDAQQATADQLERIAEWYINHQ